MDNEEWVTFTMTCDEHEALRKEAGHMHRFLQRLNAPDRLFPRLLETFLRVRARDEPAFARQLLRSGGAKEVAQAVCTSRSGTHG
jgi:hypothetical protein